ncbi:MAG: hypothetical protein ACREDF_02575 [Thermoplasmata archaeon]
MHLSDGTVYEVRHPEMALLTRSTVAIGIEHQPGQGIADDMIYVSLVHIVRAEHVNGHPG